MGSLLLYGNLFTLPITVPNVDFYYFYPCRENVVVLFEKSNIYSLRNRWTIQRFSPVVIRAVSSLQCSDIVSMVAGKTCTIVTNVSVLELVQEGTHWGCCPIQVQLEFWIMVIAMEALVSCYPYVCK